LYDFPRLFLSTYNKKRIIGNGGFNGKDEVTGSIPVNGSIKHEVTPQMAGSTAPDIKLLMAVFLFI